MSHKDVICNKNRIMQISYKEGDNMLRTVIGESNYSDRIILKKMLCRIPDIQIEGDTDNGVDLIDLVEKTTPHIIIIDFSIWEMNVVETAKRISEILPRSFIIFATDKESYPREIYDTFAFYYMFKPYDFKRLFRIIERIKQIVFNYSRLSKEIDENISSNLQITNRPCKKILINRLDGMLIVDSCEVTMITRCNRKTEIYTDNKIHKISTPLSSIESKLGYNFFRSHKGYIVNTDKICQIESWGNKTFLVSFYDAKETALMTIDRYKQFKQIYCIE